MSKLSKLLRDPALFFRDLLIKRRPIDFGNHVGRGTDGDARELVEVLPPRFPIDLVYTWVDSADPEWRNAKRQAQLARNAASELTEDTAADARFEDHEELRFSLRSVEEFAPWFRHIYIVTAGHTPTWLDKELPGLTVVPHRELIDSGHLPTFNSHVIEAHLHRIPGLSEHYVYLNDDVLFTRPVSPGEFFLGSGATLVSVSDKPLPIGEITSADTPMDAASKGVRALLKREFGVHIERQILHGPHPQRLETAREAAELIDARGLAFYDHAFREVGDLNTATLLDHYLGYLRGRAVFTRSDCMYFNIHSPKSHFCYSALRDLRGKPGCPQSMCANQVEMPGITAAERQRYDAALDAFLCEYFPAPSRYERT